MEKRGGRGSMIGSQELSWEADYNDCYNQRSSNALTLLDHLGRNPHFSHRVCYLYSTFCSPTAATVDVVVVESTCISTTSTVTLYVPLYSRAALVQIPSIGHYQWGANAYQDPGGIVTAHHWIRSTPAIWRC